jgi:hypothetical protein
MNEDIVEQVLRDYDASRHPDGNPELEAVRLAILLEDVFGVVLSDAEIEPTLLADTAAVAALVVRLRGKA